MKAIISTITGSTVSAFTILGLYLHVRAVKSGEQEAVNDTFRKGQKSLQSIHQPMPRPAAEKILWKTLVPQGPTINRYALVFGANGTGKTTTALKLAMDAKGGVVYVEVPPAGDKRSFGKALATAIGVRSKYETFSLNGMLSAVGVLSQLNTPADLVTDCLHLISNAAADYRNSNGRSPLLIIDNINQLLRTEDGIDLLILLQDYAKSSADKNALKFAFVSSDGAAVDLMKQQSSASRMELVEIADIPDQEALDFLINNLSSESRLAVTSNTVLMAAVHTCIAEVTGGRALDLCCLASALEKPDCSAATIEDFKNQAMCKVMNDFAVSDMIYTKQAHHAAMWLIADKLLTSPGLRISQTDLALSNEDRFFLKRSPVFTLHQGDVTFNSRAHATFAANSRPVNAWWRRVLGFKKRRAVDVRIL